MLILGGLYTTSNYSFEYNYIYKHNHVTLVNKLMGFLLILCLNNLKSNHINSFPAVCFDNH